MHKHHPLNACIIALLALSMFTITACTDDDEVTGPEEREVAEAFTLVEMGDVSAPMELAVQACAGLMNRRQGGSVFIINESHDQQWLDELDLQPGETMSAQAFLDACSADFSSCVRYSYADQQELLPAILTAASALEAIPLDVSLNATCQEVAFDAIAEFADRDTPIESTRYVYENFAAQTTGLAMLNPGYDIRPDDPANPPLNRDMPSHTVDFVFSEKLFVVFLINGCSDGHPERDLLDQIVNAGNWETPLGVYGYNNSWLLGGYLHEAQTRCLPSANMGAIPTETYNLSFFSTRRDPIRDPSQLEQPVRPEVTYDPTKTYVSFIIGDGDNIDFIMSTRKDWILQRLDDCAKPDSACLPLTWSISPHLNTIAPDVLEWYFAAANQTGRDDFVLPPSGHLYAYPSDLAESSANVFVTATEDDARMLGTNSVVHWEWNGAWENAQANFLPRYATADGAIRGIYPVNVPYIFEAFPEWPEEWFYKIIDGQDGGQAVIFRPRAWRGVHGDTTFPPDEPFFLTPAEMADELANYPPGTVTGIYTTSDGGLNIENSFIELSKLLPPHVEVVSANTLAELALQAGM